jgi:glycosyltransferase involved in cell wall biosynthesis
LTGKPAFLLFEACDFLSFPPGGQLTMARHIMAAFPGEVGLVGIATEDSAQVGEWHTRSIANVEYPYFAIRRRDPNPARPLIPARLATYLALTRHRKAILSLGVRHAFCQGHETLLAIAGWPWKSLCYDFPGVANPLAISRYPWARPLGALFDRFFFRALCRASVVLATADRTAILDMCQRSGGGLSPEQVHVWPTRVDTSIFRPAVNTGVRESLGVDPNAVLIVTTGRLNWIKGWPLLLEVLAESDARWQLIFVGDGEDREALVAMTREKGISDRVTVTGFQPPSRVAEYIQAADVFALASHQEGFSTSMLEALACGKPIVSTAVSSADTIVEEGVNGFVVRNRNCADFHDGLCRALALQKEQVLQFNLQRITAYAVNTIREDLRSAWPFA